MSVAVISRRPVQRTLSLVPVRNTTLRLPTRIRTWDNEFVARQFCPLAYKEMVLQKRGCFQVTTP